MPARDDADLKRVADAKPEDLNQELLDENEALRDQLVWGFYEEEAPEYTQGNEKLHELHELVTAEECNRLVRTVKALRERNHDMDRLKATNAALAKALEWFDLHANSLAADLSSAHRSRGEGGSQWMAEDDRDFRADFRKAIEKTRTTLQTHGPAKESGA